MGGEPKGKKGKKAKAKAKPHPGRPPPNADAKYPSTGVPTCKQLTPTQKSWARKQTPVDEVTGKSKCWGHRVTVDARSLPSNAASPIA